MPASLAVLVLLAALATPHAFAAPIPAPPKPASAVEESTTPPVITPDAPVSEVSSAIFPEPAASSSSSSFAPVIAPTPVTERNQAERPTRWQKRAWIGLTVAQHSAAVFDAWSTRKSITSGNGHELNPLVKPFANSNAVYPALQVVPLGFDFLSRRMMKSSNPVARKLWWLPQAGSSVTSVLSGLNNLRVASRH